MKNKFLRSLIAFMLALLMLLTLPACKKDDDGGDDDDTSSSTSEDPNNPGSSTTLTGAAIPRYLRVVDFADGSATLKFNVYSDDKDVAFDIRYSEKEITEKNFDKATKADYSLTGEVEKTLVVKGITPSLSKAYWVAVKSTAGMEIVRVGGNKQIPIDYETKMNSVYHGETNKSLFALFDEQYLASSLIFPSTNLGVLFGDPNDTKGNQSNIDQGKAGMNLSPIVDLEYKHYISTVNLFFKDIAEDYGEIKVRWSLTPVDFRAEDDKWDGTVTLTKDQLTPTSWNEIEIGAVTRYVQVIFKDGYAPNEIHLYGYQKGEGDPISTTLHKLPTVGEILGMCGFTAGGGGHTTTDQLACVNVMREYHNFGWSYAETAYPGKSNLPGAGWTGNFDSLYSEFSKKLLVIPCVQWDSRTGIARQVDEDGLPVKGSDGKFITEINHWKKCNPEVYFLYADNMYWFAARYGSNTSADTLKTLKAHTQTPTTAAGAGTIKWLEFGNEPNGEDSLGFVPYQLAALQSAAYDGHQGTLTSTQVEKNGYHFGAVNGDPNMKVAIAGLAGLQTRYMITMVYWLKANRTDGNVAFDAFNYHSYFGYTYYLNGVDLTVGVCPESFGIVQALSPMIEYRNKYYPEKEVWLTEFGWDTNQSYETMTSCHAYNVTDLDGDGDIDEDDKFARVHQIHGDWLVRAYILFSSCGLDKATMYMCEDAGDERTSVGKYGTCGIWDEDGKAKDAYYYIYTLKSNLNDYTFTREIATGNNNVWLYEFKNPDGKTAYLHCFQRF